MKQSAGIKNILPAALIVALVLLPVLSLGASYQQVTGLIDLRSTFSDGACDIETLVQMAHDRGIDALIINDHDRMVMEYGIPPFRNIFKKRVERNSINRRGAANYLSTIRKISKAYPRMIIIPGSESAPFYYWTGSFFQKDLTAHDHEKRILTIGMDNPEDYEDLPLLHNGPTTHHLDTVLPGLILLVLALAGSLILMRWKGIYRISGIIVFILSVACIVNCNPFRSSPFDQYHGNQGITPYQLLIDYVQSKGGMTFWNYPETRSGTRKLGPIRVHTPPYPEVLVESQGYTGFAALYGDTITVTEPGNVWDQVLIDYCRGERETPVWGIATADFHDERGSCEKLGNFRTVFLLQQRTRSDVLTALRQGNMYACHTDFRNPVRLDEFSVSSSDGNQRGIAGNTILLTGQPSIRIALSVASPSQKSVQVRLIRSGHVIKTVTGTLPLHIDYRDNYFRPGETIYYRMDMRGSGTIVTNPIFVECARGKTGQSRHTEPAAEK